MRGTKLLIIKRVDDATWRENKEDEDESLNEDSGDGGGTNTTLLPAGRDLLLESPCNVKRFLALAAEWPDWLLGASAEWESKKEEELVEQRKMKKSMFLLFDVVASFSCDSFAKVPLKQQTSL